MDLNLTLTFVVKEVGAGLLVAVLSLMHAFSVLDKMFLCSVFPNNSSVLKF